MRIPLPFNFQFRCYFSQLEKRVGACSQLHEKPDEHILLWDFDDNELSEILESLSKVQRVYNLPEIRVIESSENHYHAYCFSAYSFREAIEILSSVPEIDMEYLRLGVIRGYYTLRITPRKGEKFNFIKLLTSETKSKINWFDITVNEYLTSNKGGK